MKRFILLGVMGLVLLGAAPAMAHTSLSSSNIVDGSEIVSLPDTLDLTFSKPVGLAAVRLEGPGGVTKDLPTKKAMQKNHRLAFPTLAPGRYRLAWRAVAEDGHIMTGEISFSVIAD